ncbi:hypothetical protein AGOR_G00092210 [Albula goreensis]|uniref:C3H1-type domain-containing protein n=1 Tax=Albula goreensis TaxID=1534307 RepID=A0A8T3DPM5_9TELE|nr:hypothetical protein AGOR_G00092210 [Albula goreensis]
MSNIIQERSERYQAILQGLQFMGSTLPFDGTQEQYEVFLQDLVKNLLGEGNDVYREGNWASSMSLYTEALDLIDYADSEDISISSEMVEKLYANRAATYLNMGVYDQALRDCQNALQRNENSPRALYRKARCLKELKMYKEAYDALAKCSLAVPQNESVQKLLQELAKTLGLKIRKAYVRSQPNLLISLPAASNLAAVLSGDECPEGSLDDVEMVSHHTADIPLPGPGRALSPTACETLEGGPGQVSTVSSVTPIEPGDPESSAAEAPALVGAAGVSEQHPKPASHSQYDTEIIGDDLDELLDRAIPSEPPVAIPVMREPVPASLPDSEAVPLLKSSDIRHTFTPLPYHQAESSGYSAFGLDSLSSLDGLSISEPETKTQGYGQPATATICGNAGGVDETTSSSSDLKLNPLAHTHEFKQACSACFKKCGPGLFDYTLLPDEHKCKKDLLLGRLRHSADLAWRNIRPRPKNQYEGPYYICKDVALGEDCHFPGKCTFAYCQEEIDVWTLERKGVFSREHLFDPFGTNEKIILTVPKILQEHHGTFMFLCEVCFDHKPRLISKINKDNPTLCAHSETKHDFEENKCLVYVLSDASLKYLKVRPYHRLCQTELCRHAIRYGCSREDECFFAHSLIELKVWIMQQEMGITQKAIVQESKKYWMSMKTNSEVAQAPELLMKFGPSNQKLQFVCGQCWTNGQVSLPDKNRKYCVAKARHYWSKDKEVVLVKSTERKTWTAVRPLPAKKPLPSRFEICLHVSSGRKCQYIGNCGFAHSPEERDLWQYMKDKNIPDMEKLHDCWLASQWSDWSEDTATSAMRENGKQIHMPTDYAEDVAGNHCWLCGKHCNSTKQWQQHITSEKHKDKVFHSEDDENCWQYRFPTGTFKLCERFAVGTCTEEQNCKLAHGPKELKEWEDRKEFLLRKLTKAKKDGLIAPDDDDFGKYSFLLK